MNKQPNDGKRLPLKQAADSLADTDLAHRVAEVLTAFDGNITNPQAFINRVRHIEYGTSAEMEFAAILGWLGQCALVHQLGQQAFSSGPRPKCRVPDLFAIFQRDGLTFPVLIEVKTTKGWVLSLTADYVNTLYEYARLVSRPLLIAWRPRTTNFWLLLDPQQAQKAGSKLLFPLEEAIKANLMGWLAGDFWIQIIQGVGAYFELERTSDRHQRKASQWEPLTVRKAEFRDAEGKHVEPSQGLLSILVAAAEVREEVTEECIKHSFVAGGMIQGQQVLRTLLSWSLKSQERIHWRHVGRSLDSITQCDHIRAEAHAYLGRFFHLIFTQTPLVMPDFIPPAWRRK